MLELAREDLARSGISPEEAEEAGLYAVEDCRAELGPAFLPVPAIVIPYPDPSGDLIQYKDARGELRDFFRVRYLALPHKATGWKGKVKRYAQPPRSGVHPYFPHLDDLDWREVLADPTQPIIITEGEKKALRACLSGHNCIGLGGVYNFLRQQELVPMLDAATWESRLLYVCYDSDSASNTDIQAAEARLAGELVKRGAKVRVVRLPSTEGEHGDEVKQGIDDFLEAEGDRAFHEVLRTARMTGKLGALEQAILSMNERVAWIDSTGALIDLDTHKHILTKDFEKGTKLASEYVTVPAPRAQDGVKKLYVAPNFLKSPLARRYADVVCDPTTLDREIWREKPAKGWAYNTFEGFPSEPGDVSDFVTLSRYVFKNMEDPDFGIKFFAYKAQNPGEKVPLGFALVAPHGGSGKSLWSKIVAQAFQPHATTCDGAQLGSRYNGWLEGKMIVLYDEAKPEAVAAAKDNLKRYVSEKTFPCEEKFINKRDADQHATFILTSNHIGVALYDREDRRMVVVEPPHKKFDPIPDPGVYKRLYSRLEGSAEDAYLLGANLMHFFQNYDLKGWEPPADAPASALKEQALEDSLSYAEHVAHGILQGLYVDDPVIDWCKAATAWAHENLDSRDPRNRDHAQIVLDTLPHLRVRPWYTPEELLALLPHLQNDAKVRRSESSPHGALSNVLRSAGLPTVQLSSSRRPIWQGRETTFYYVTMDPEWHKPMTQNQFDTFMRNTPRLRDVLKEK